MAGSILAGKADAAWEDDGEQLGLAHEDPEEGVSAAPAEESLTQVHTLLLFWVPLQGAGCDIGQALLLFGEFGW